MSLVQLYKALADETRLRILSILTHGRYSVNELQDILQMGQSRVSRHLKLLTDAGLARVHREGTWAYYESADEDDTAGIGTQLELIKLHREEFPEAGEDENRRFLCLENRRRKSRAFHDRIAPHWSKLRQELMDDGVSAGILEKLKGCDVVADLGCGAGEMVAQLAPFVGRTIGVDSSPAMLEQAGQTLSGRPDGQAGSVELRLGTLEHLPLADAEADGALLNMVLHHLADPPAVLQEVRRILSPGGTLLVCDLARHDEEGMREKFGDQWLGFTEQELNQFLELANLEVISIQPCNETSRPGIILAAAHAPLNKGENK